MATNDDRGWFRRLFSRSKKASLDPSRADLVVVARCFDDARACSSVLDAAAVEEPVWDLDEDVVLRHHLLLPADTVDDAAAIAAQDDYAVGGPGEIAEAVERAAEVENAAHLVLERVQVLDALHCSQERSRMAGLAQRRGGIVLGWEALQPATSPPGPTR